MRFEVFWGSEKTADVTVSENSVDVRRHTTHPAKQIFYSDRLTRYELGNILRSRCFDEHRPDIKQLLSKMGLEEYDVYNICRATHGVMAQDPIWFRFEGEAITWETVRGSAA